MSIIVDLVIMIGFVLLLMLILWFFMRRMDNDFGESSKTTTMFVWLLIGISVLAFILWVFWG